MTIEELELGLTSLHWGKAGDLAFWNENILAFRRTLLFAIGETTALLATTRMSPNSVTELHRELVRLRRYLGIADEFVRSRELNRHRGHPVIN